MLSNVPFYEVLSGRAYGDIYLINHLLNAQVPLYQFRLYNTTAGEVSVGKPQKNELIRIIINMESCRHVSNIYLIKTSGALMLSVPICRQP